ncbi:MAG: hypothetical protein U0271_28560 [Polyangiaceae bacterium]
MLLLAVLAHGDGIAATVRWSVIAAVAMLVIDLSVHVLVLPPEFVPSPAHYLPVRLALLALFAAFSITTRRVHNAQVMRIADKERENRAQAWRCATLATRPSPRPARRLSSSRT